MKVRSKGFLKTLNHPFRTKKYGNESSISFTKAAAVEMIKKHNDCYLYSVVKYVFKFACYIFRINNLISENFMSLLGCGGGDGERNQERVRYDSKVCKFSAIDCNTIYIVIFSFKNLLAPLANK